MNIEIHNCTTGGMIPADIWSVDSLRERHCAAAVIGVSILSAACVSAAPLNIMN